MVGTCENASPQDRVGSMFLVLLTFLGLPQQILLHQDTKEETEWETYPPTPLLKKRHPHRTAKNPVVRACNSEGTGTWESRPHVWQAHLLHSQEKLYPPGYWLFWALCSGFLQEHGARSQKFFHAKVSSKTTSFHEKFWWKKCFLGKFLASCNLHIKSWPWIYSSVLHTCWLEPSKTVPSSGSSSTPPLGHVKSCILWVLYNLPVKNAVLFLGLLIKLLYFSGAKHQDVGCCNFPFYFHLVTPSDSPSRDHLRCPPWMVWHRLYRHRRFSVTCKGLQGAENSSLAPCCFRRAVPSPK